MTKYSRKEGTPRTIPFNERHRAAEATTPASILGDGKANDDASADDNHLELSLERRLLDPKRLGRILIASFLDRPLKGDGGPTLEVFPLVVSLQRVDLYSTILASEFCGGPCAGRIRAQFEANAGWVDP